VLGHELLGRVREAPEGSDVDVGTLVAGIVRRPDPVPCVPCAQGEWDMCRNGLFTERGIKGLDGYGAELVTLEADFAIPVDARLGELGAAYHTDAGDLGEPDADPAWLGGLITRTVALERWEEALEKGDDDIKVVVDFDG
jgi:hypothetical protein